jgi:hypothetical protein
MDALFTFYVLGLTRITFKNSARTAFVNTHRLYYKEKRSVLCREMIFVCSENYANRISKLNAQNVESVMLTPVAHQSKFHFRLVLSEKCVLD